MQPHFPHFKDILRCYVARKRRDATATMSSVLTALGFNGNNGAAASSNSASGTAAGNAILAPSSTGNQAIDLFSRGLLMLKQITETQMMSKEDMIISD